MKLKLIACEILFRELSFLAAKSPHRIDIEFLPKGLHDLGRKGMFNRVNEVFSQIDESQYDAILLGYALCNGGIVGLTARTIPVILPRAHDCITLFLGNRKRYMDYFDSHPGTYFKTTGWIERGGDVTLLAPDSIQTKNGMNISYHQMIEKYGKDNAKYLWEQLHQMVHYRRMTFIETGLEPSDRFENETRQLAIERGWIFEKLTGDLTLLKRLLNGEWDGEDFLILVPGKSIQFDYSEKIVGSGQ